MIADDSKSIRESMKKLAQAKVQGQAEAARKAEADEGKANLPQHKPLFPESGTPYRGFFVTEDGDIRPAQAFDQEAWDEWDHVTLNAGFSEVVIG